MKAFYNFLTTYATKRNIIVGFILIVLFNVFLFSKFSELVADNEIAINSLLDTKFSYSTNVAYTVFESLGKEGRNTYTFLELCIDFPYAVTYGFTYAFIIIVLLKLNKLQKLNYLSVAPFLISWFDILENSGIVVMLSKYPTKLNVICSLTSTFTSLKWIFAIITFMVVLVNLIYLLNSKILIKTKN